MSLIVAAIVAASTLARTDAIDVQAGVAALERDLANMPHAGASTLCLGAIGTSALVFKAPRRANTTRTVSSSQRTLAMASAPRSGASWLAASLERAQRFTSVATTHYPFFDDRQRLVDGTWPEPAVLVVRNPFEAYRSYRDNLRALSLARHRTSAAWPELSLDEFSRRWLVLNRYWAENRSALVLSLESVAANPRTAVGETLELGDKIVAWWREQPAAARRAPAPTLSRTTRRCGTALVGVVSSAHELETLVAHHDLSRYGYSLAKAPQPWHVVESAA